MNLFESNIINIYGNKGRVWLADLPKLVKTLSLRFGLRNLTPAPNLTYNYILLGLQNDRPIVLKLGLDCKGLAQEAFALKVFDGQGAIKLLAEDSGLLLLEKAIPATSLKCYFPTNETESIEITCSLIQKLHQAKIPQIHPCPHIKNWLEALDKHWNIPHKYLQKARKLRYQLLKTKGADVFLHGDLHHNNILKNGNTWVAIDPKGIIGEPAYEIASFILNPQPELLESSDSFKIIQKRILACGLLLKIPTQRILDFCFVRSVLGWVWALEDGCDASYFRQLAQLLSK